MRGEPTGAPESATIMMLLRTDDVMTLQTGSSLPSRGYSGPKNTRRWIGASAEDPTKSPMLRLARAVEELLLPGRPVFPKLRTSHALLGRNPAGLPLSRRQVAIAEKLVPLAEVKFHFGDKGVIQPCGSSRTGRPGVIFN